MIKIINLKTPSLKRYVWKIQNMTLFKHTILVLTDIFNKLEHLMSDTHIFKNPDLDRDTIIQLLNINRNQLSQMMNENAGGKSIFTYINDYRVRHACEMMRLNKDVSMQMVCFESGFKTVRNFNRIFKQQLSLTPLEYKSGLSHN